jgi:hypothetical protein
MYVCMYASTQFFKEPGSAPPSKGIGLRFHRSSATSWLWNRVIENIESNKTKTKKQLRKTSLKGTLIGRHGGSAEIQSDIVCSQFKTKLSFESLVLKKLYSWNPGVDVMITIFCDFHPFSAKKWRFSSKPMVWSKFCSVLWTKNAN